MSNNGKATMKDVAQKAGVSLVTVSRTLRSPNLVNDQTKLRVNNAISELGYILDMAAGSLASRRSGLIAVIVPSLDNSVFSTTVQGLSDHLEPTGLELMLGSSGLSTESEEHLVRTFLGRRPEGIVLTGTSHTKSTTKLLKFSGVPVVETWNMTKRPIDLNVGFSNEQAAYAITRHLIETGRTKIGLISGSLAFNDRAQARHAGFKKAVDEAGLDTDITYELPFPGATAAIPQALSWILARQPKLDALYCSGDAFAVSALFECQRRSISVPGDIAIAGLGDIEMASQAFPSLTTAKVPGYEMGKVAADLILKRINNEPTKRKIFDLGFEVIRRETS